MTILPERDENSMCGCICHTSHVLHIMPCCSRTYEQRGPVSFDEPDKPIVKPEKE